MKSSQQQKMKIIEDSLNFVFETPDLWNDFDLKKYPILFVSIKDKTAHLYSKGQINKFSYSELPPELKKNPVVFTQDNIQDVKTLVIFLDGFEDSDRHLPLLSFTIHEAFHLYYQSVENKSWKERSDRSSQRGTLLPFFAEARYLRWEMAQALSRFLYNGDTNEILAFSSYYYRWSKEYPHEFNSFVDRAEGSAEYVTFVALNKLTNKFHSIDKTHELLRSTRSKWFTGERLAFDHEAYLLGVLSGLSLQKLGKSDWKDKVDSGTSQLEMLARMFESNFVIPINPLKLKEFGTMIMTRMNEIDKDGKIVILLDKLKRKKVNFIALKSGISKPFGFSPNGIYQIAHPLEHKMYVDLIDVATPVRIVSFDNSLLMEVEPHLMITMGKTPCDGGSGDYLVWPVGTEFFEADKLHSYKPLNLLTKPKVNSHHGSKWLCIDW